ncbi:uncharacterized protein LOC126797108 [Argentina anserina]|uniref:uncharacterized protein LOC126797108 n=1 Tax=Argentina anserina TaxID=57926 RepID=UPI002176617B|nr:uncharacterized protein LOC126797108 [Potentilla anserina]
MASSRKWATTISFIASSIYFTVIIIQIPLFSVPCRSGTCTSPVAVTAPQLMACDLIPTVAIKALVYPGAVAKALVKNEAIPSFSNLKLHDPSAVTAADAIADLQRLEVLVGSYLSVAGAFWGLLKPWRVSFYGVLLILWGLVKEIMLRKSAGPNLVYIHPAMSIAICSALFSIAKDVRRIIRSFRGLQIVKEKRS